MELDYKLDDSHPVPIIKLGGRFDAEAAAFVKGQISYLVDEQQPNLIIDLSEVTFVDSLGLTALVSGLKCCRKNRGTLKLVGLQPVVRVLFEITRLDRAFDLYEDTDKAFAAFQRESGQV